VPNSPNQLERLQQLPGAVVQLATVLIDPHAEPRFLEKTPRFLAWIYCDGHVSLLQRAGSLWVAPRNYARGRTPVRMNDFD